MLWTAQGEGGSGCWLSPTADFCVCAGYVMVSCLNVLLILVIGMSSDEGTKISVPQQSAYSNGPPPHTTPTYPSR